MPNTITYEWSQTVTSLSLRLRIPSLKADLQQRRRDRQLSVVVASCYIRVCWHPWFLEVDLWGDVAFQSATITPAVDYLTIIVPKVEEGMWGSLTAVSNPALQQDIRERRRSALAAYADWQEQLQHQRTAAREARRQEQQKHIWRQQQEQREWHEHQRSIQVKQVLEQLPEDTEHSAVCGGTREVTPPPLADEQPAEHKWKGLCEPSATEDTCSYQDGQQQLQPDGPAFAADSGEESCRNGTLGNNHSVIVEHDVKPYTRERNKELRTKTPAARPATQRDACIEQKSTHAAFSTSLAVCAKKDLLGASNYGQLAMPEVQSVSPSPCTTVKVSFAARRPNRAPARGPLPPPLPQTEPGLSSEVRMREKPEDLSRLQEASPLWLQSKAGRLLLGGDAAAADEAYSLILKPSQHQSLHRLVHIKALCGRSLARLASGNAKKALSDCNEAMTLLQELQQQEDAAAAVAGQPLERGPLQAELSHLQHVLLARRAAAFLRLDALEDAEKSLQELLQLHPSQTVAMVDDVDIRNNESLQQQRAAVSADLCHIRRLKQMREMKDDGDTLLRLTLASQQETGGVNARPARRREADGSYEGEQSSTVGSTAEQDPKMHSILQRSIHNYIDCLTLLVSPPPAGCKTPESIMISEGNVDATLDVAQTEAVTRARTATFQLRAAVKASTAANTSLPWAAAAATVLANLALALMQLKETSSVPAAESSLKTAETLIHHAEECLRRQHIETTQSLSQAKERKESAEDSKLSSGRCTTELSHYLPPPVAAGHLGMLHQANEQLLRKLRQKIYSSRVQAQRQL